MNANTFYTVLLKDVYMQRVNNKCFNCYRCCFKVLAFPEFLTVFRVITLSIIIFHVQVLAHNYTMPCCLARIVLHYMFFLFLLLGK